MKRLEFCGNNKAIIKGFEMPEADIIERTDDIIVIKVPGHKYQYGYSSTETVAYAKAEFMVFEIVSQDPDWLNVKEIISFPVRSS